MPHGHGHDYQDGAARSTYTNKRNIERVPSQRSQTVCVSRVHKNRSCIHSCMHLIIPCIWQPNAASLVDIWNASTRHLRYIEQTPVGHIIAKHLKSICNTSGRNVEIICPSGSLLGGWGHHKNLLSCMQHVPRHIVSYSEYDAHRSDLT